MTTEELNSPAYIAGVDAGKDYNAEPTSDNFDGLPNPYKYGSNDWQLWNLGWNYTVMELTPPAE